MNRRLCRILHPPVGPALHRGLHLSFLLLIAQFLITFPAEALVTRRVPQQYSSIQSAINAARTGDTVLVDHGVYYENIRIRKNIVIASHFVRDSDTSHISRTIIDGSRALDKTCGSTITISGPCDTSCTVIGLTIRGGTGSFQTFAQPPPFDRWVGGGGIAIDHAGARIAHNHILDNHVAPVDGVHNTTGGAISSNGGSGNRDQLPFLIVEKNVVMGNTVSGHWTEVGGISVVQPAVIRNNVIMYNRAMARTRAPGGGLGIYTSGEYDIRVEGNYIRSNAGGFGGGILVGSASPRRGRGVIINNIVAHNHAYELGGGVHVAENASAILINNTIVENIAGTRRDGVNSVASAMTTMINNIVWNDGKANERIWSGIRLINNLTNEDLHGINTLNADPLFVPGDSLYRLTPASPAVGTGTSLVILGGERIHAPGADYSGRPRSLVESGKIDLGANESGLSPGDQNEQIFEYWADERESRKKVTFRLRQTGPPKYDTDSLQILQAGMISASLIIDDSDTLVVGMTSPELTVALPPPPNLLEVELIARGRNDSIRLYGVLRLEGFDGSGLVVPRAQAYGYRQFKDLPPGSYVLATYAGDETGFIGGSNRRSIRIDVAPFWFQRWWAYVGLSTVVILIVGLVSTLEVSRLRRERRLLQQFAQGQLEVQESGRKRLAAELHDGLGQDLLVVNNELRQFLADSQAPSERLQQVAALVQESVETVREISSNLHPHHLERLGLRVAIDALVEKMFRSSSLKVSCDCEPLDDDMSKDARLHVYRIIQESLVNISKHACATEVRIDLHRLDGQIEVSVRDNGKGFDSSMEHCDQSENDIAKGFGLASMKERARILGGSLAVDSRPNAGTVTRLTFPLLKG